MVPLLNIGGLVLDIVGVVILWVFGGMTRGHTTNADVQQSGLKKWDHLGLALIVAGFIALLVGNILTYCR